MDLTAAAAAAEEPGFAPAGVPRLGGVDPLGLRQINFDLMDQVLPGFNNVARHIRPFVLVAWAWRRAHQRAQSIGTDAIKQGELQDFVDRIEVIYVWSQFLMNPNADLPGRQVLASLLQAEEYTFGGPQWQQRRKVRRYSTALSAPINYGPGLRAFGWIHAHTAFPEVMVPSEAAAPALDEFEAKIAALLTHDAFNQFGSVVVRRDEVRSWAESWRVSQITKGEASVMRELLCGLAAPSSRRLGTALIVSAAEHSHSTKGEDVRAAMSGLPSDFVPPEHLLETREAWRRVQMRQLFRLSLEGVFYWVLTRLKGTASSIDVMVKEFLEATGQPEKVSTAGEWLESFLSEHEGPTELLTRISRGLANPSDDELPRSIVMGVALCLTDHSETECQTERRDRLPLLRARQEALARAAGPVDEFVRHVFESWVLAQHAYWSVGRGLADARARGKTLLRLKVILDEGGWTLTPGMSPGGQPMPTPDRLQTAISIATECGIL